MLFKVLDAIAKTPEYTLLSDTKSGDFMNSNSKKTNKIINFIVSNYTRSIRLEDVSDFANLNKTSFCRYFKSFTQKTFTQYLNELRIAKACDLLLNTDKPVTSICYETGYNNISHFNRQFKAITGITAREYRKK
jgi:AraC-like DNA-binding protein